MAASEPDDGEPDAESNDANDEPNVDEPNADEPNADEPNADEPNADEPNADEPNADEPNADGPNADGPPSVPSIRVPREGVPRYVAASLDQLLTLVAIVVIAKFLHKRPDMWQWITIVVVYLGYFLLFEGLFATTPGKLLTGLVVVGYDGRRCTWRQAWTRTWMRILEVNPLLLGAIPAGLKIVFSPYHQRYGDILARTLVVPRSSVVRRKSVVRR